MITDGNGDGAGSGRSVCVLELRLKPLPPDQKWPAKGGTGGQDLREVQVGGGAHVSGHRQIPGEVPGRAHVRVIGARADCEYERES